MIRKYYKDQMKLMTYEDVIRGSMMIGAWRCILFYHDDDIYDDDMRKYCNIAEFGMAFLVK
jgi:hypothetical protein